MKPDQARPRIRLMRQEMPILATAIGIFGLIGSVVYLLYDRDKILFAAQAENRVIGISVLICLVAGIILLAFAWVFLNIPYYKHKAKEEAAQAEKIERLVHTRAKVARLIKSERKVFGEIEEMKQRLEQVEYVAGVNNTAIVYGHTPEKLVDGVTSSTFEAKVLDKDGRKLAYVVVYLFPDSAFWRYMDSFGYEDLDGRPLSFLRILKDGEFLERLKSNQQLIGVGLESSAGEGSSYANQRAAYLCGSLFALTGGSIPVYGLDLGQYRGEKQHKNSRVERRQRSVILVGIREIKEGVQARPLLPEILNLVAIPGVDLHSYNRVGNPVWIETRNCSEPPLHFEGR